jgi:hypothetical protein
MPARANFAALPQPLRWLIPSLGLAVLAAIWVRFRPRRLSLPSVSSEWLSEHRRRTVQRRDDF